MKTILSLFAVAVLATLTIALTACEDSHVKSRPSGKPWIVKQDGSGDFTKIHEAVKRASNGDSIHIYPGIYTRGLIIDKKINIKGIGERSQIIMEITDNYCILFHKTGRGSIRNMTLRNSTTNEEAEVPCVFILSENVLLANNSITSKSFTGIMVSGSGIAPLITGNSVHNSKNAGILVIDGAKGHFENNNIIGNMINVFILDEADPTFVGNDIRRAKTFGVIVSKNSKGYFQDNTIEHNLFAGIVTRAGGNPTLEDNRINGNGDYGIWIAEDGRITAINNNLTGNSRGAWRAEDGAGKLVLHGNKK